MVEIELAGHWTGQLEWLPTDQFAKTAPDWAAPEMLGRALSAETRPNFMHMSVVPKMALSRHLVGFRNSRVPRSMVPMGSAIIARSLRTVHAPSFKRHPDYPCAQCGEQLIVPEWSEYVDGYRVRHV